MTQKLTMDFGLIFKEGRRGNRRHLDIQNTLDGKIQGMIHRRELRIEKEIWRRLSDDQLRTVKKLAEDELQKRGKQ